MDCLDEIRKILNEELEVDPATINADTPFQQINVDSLLMVELLFQLEDRLQISLEGGKDMPELKTVGDLVKYIETKL